MQLRKLFKAYLLFTRKDRLGVLALLVMVALITALPFLTAPGEKPFPAEETVLLINDIDTVSADDSGLTNKYGFPRSTSEHAKAEPPFVKGELFPFDPNTLSAEGWQRLGLNSKTSNTIVNYRNKGGKFYRPEDIKKIWGMPEPFFQRIKPYVVIASEAGMQPQNRFETPPYTKQGLLYAMVDLSTADTSSLIALPGIGRTLANRIVKFRESLGGFYSVAQIAQVYGLQDSTFQKIKGYLQLSAEVKKLNLNTATKDELKKHPYIGWNLANAIVEYRNQHGAFNSLTDLKNIVLIDEETYGKVVHYLSL